MSDSIPRISKGQKPIDTVFAQGVVVSVFEKEISDEDGSQRHYRQYTVQRAYQDKDSGKTQYGHSFSATDLLRIAEAATHAYAIHELRTGE